MSTIKKYLWVAHLFAIAVCAYFAAQTVTTYISMLLEQESQLDVAAQKARPDIPKVVLASADDYALVINRNIFNSAKIEADPEIPEEESRGNVDLSGPAVKTTLNIKVLGTLVVGEGTDDRSSATVVGGKSRKPEVYFVKGQETFDEGVELLRVKPDRIEFANKGRLEYAMLEGVSENITIFGKAEDVHGKSDGKVKPRRAATRATPRATRSGEKTAGKFVIDQGEVDEALANLDRLYTEVRIVPNFKDGQPAGMKVLAVKPGSLFSKLGIKRGDILERINGMELDIRKGMELFAQLRDQKNLKVDLVRRGKKETLEYEIK